MTEAQPYAFGRPSAQPSAMLGAMEKLGDRLARKLRAIIEPYSGVRPSITPRPVDKTIFMMWDACVPNLTSLSLYRLHPIRGTTTLRIDAALVSLLVDRFYGGTGHRHGVERKEFTPTENRVITRLSAQIMSALAETAADLVPIEAHLLAREANVTQADIMAGESDVLCQAFEIDLGEKEKYVVEFVYPLDGLNALEPLSNARSADTTRAPDPVWQTHLARRMEDVHLPAKTILARPNIKMSELVALQPGDVIPIHIARHLPLLIGDRVFAHGSIGEQDGRAAFMIEKLA